MGETELFAVVVLLVALALVAAIAVTSLGSRIRVPAPALFLLAAAVVSNVVPDLGRISLVIDERIVTVALILILFDGGMHIGWRRFRTTAGPITFVGAVGTALTAAAVALIAHLLLGLEWQAALLLGAALSPTDPAVVLAVLGRKEVEGRSGTLLEGESGFNEPVGIALLAVLLTAGTGASVVVGGVSEFLLQMVVGIAVGALGGLALGWLQRRIRLPNEALRPLRTIAFTVLGLSVSVTDVIRTDVWVPALILAALLVLVIRPVLVGPLLLPIRLAWGERAFVLLAGPEGRGADPARHPDPGRRCAGCRAHRRDHLRRRDPVRHRAGRARAAARGVVPGAHARRGAAALRRRAPVRRGAARPAAVRRPQGLALHEGDEVLAFAEPDLDAGDLFRRRD